MKKIYILRMNALLGVVAAIFLVTQVAAQQAYLGAKNPNASTVTAEKPVIDYSYKHLPPSGREGGETIATAIPITSLPFNDSGNTCDNLNDYDAGCPYSGSIANDVVYSFTPGVDISVDIDLCGSAYDTKVYVYQNSTGDLIGCNDDYYFDETCGVYVSAIFNLVIYAGNTYYIVVDGYYNDCGNYILNVTGEEPVICSECLPCSAPEGEPDIPDNGLDVTNGGCNETNLWTPIVLNQVICGRANTYTYYGSEYRDTDWYEITLTEAGTLYLTGYAMFELQLLLIYNADCNNLQYVSGIASNCSRVSLSRDLPAGTYWFWAGPTFFTGMNEGQNYNVIATLNAPPPEGLCMEQVPVANWPIYLAIGLIAMAAAFRFWRRS